MPVTSCGAETWDFTKANLDKFSEESGKMLRKIPIMETMEKEAQMRSYSDLKRTVGLKKYQAAHLRAKLKEIKTALYCYRTEKKRRTPCILRLLCY